MKKVILFVASALLVSTMAVAQVKLGHINSNELLKAMPEMTKAEKAIQDYAKTFQETLQGMGKEYEKKVQEFQAQEKTMTDALKDVKIKEIQDLQARIETTNQSAQEKVEAKRQELLQPIIDKADKAIKDVAKEKGYNYVFDSSVGALLYAEDSDNILAFVKAKLGIQ